MFRYQYILDITDYIYNYNKEDRQFMIKFVPNSIRNNKKSLIYNNKKELSL